MAVVKATRVGLIDGGLAVLGDNGGPGRRSAKKYRLVGGLLPFFPFLQIYFRRRA